MPKKYTYEEAIEDSKKYFNGDELAADVFITKYALRNEHGELIEKTPDQMHLRLAKEFARIEKKYPNPMSQQEIYDLFDMFKWIIPQGSPMSAIGNDVQFQTIGNCYVLPSCEDSYGGILYTDQQQTQIMKRRGGVGHDISNIRPKGVSTKNAAKTTDGIGVFMERFSNTCREVAQNGRRGALLLSIDIRHPEISTFINIKQDKTKVTGANVSIKINDDFMNAVKNNSLFTLQWPVNSEKPKIKTVINAVDLWKNIIHCSWATAEPGLFFWDTVLRESPSDCYANLGFASLTTNPCGEIPMSSDSCRLMVINLFSFVNNKFTKDAKFDKKLFEEIVVKAQRLMDDIVDLELEKIDKILDKIQSDPESDNIKKIEFDMWQHFRKSCVSGRRTGLGITGLGDALAALGIRYGSEESVKKTEEIYKLLAINSYKSSCIMAGERGAFPIFSHKLEKGHPFLQRIWNASPEVYELYKKFGRRNIANTTTAPTGSVSTLTQTTSGIEPAYLLSYDRYRKITGNDNNVSVDRTDAKGDKWHKYTVYHHGFNRWMEVTGRTKIEDSPYYKATSNDVDWEMSVDLQAAAQKWVCHAISKTCNLPNNATEATVAKVYMRAWESGCKGFTVYRDGCRDGVLVKQNTDIKPSGIPRSNAPKRPQTLPCDIHHVKVRKDGITNEFAVFVGLLEGDPYEVFAFVNQSLNTFD